MAAYGLSAMHRLAVRQSLTCCLGAETYRESNDSAAEQCLLLQPELPTSEFRTLLVPY